LRSCRARVSWMSRARCVFSALRCPIVSLTMQATPRQSCKPLLNLGGTAEPSNCHLLERLVPLLPRRRFPDTATRHKTQALPARQPLTAAVPRIKRAPSKAQARPRHPQQQLLLQSASDCLRLLLQPARSKVKQKSFRVRQTETRQRRTTRPSCPSPEAMSTVGTANETISPTVSVKCSFATTHESNAPLGSSPRQVTLRPTPWASSRGRLLSPTPPARSRLDMKMPVMRLRRRRRTPNSGRPSTLASAPMSKAAVSTGAD